ncbi:hypothetical protein N7465_010876 [Penicillium sp. CMV-2018d]|nr:hypothetical protein N7465_010876 [Penicillium sp. CMV-2018d]
MEYGFDIVSGHQSENNVKLRSCLATATGCLNRLISGSDLPDPQPSSMPRYFPWVSINLVCLHLLFTPSAYDPSHSHPCIAKPSSPHCETTRHVYHPICPIDSTDTGVMPNVAPQALKAPQERIKAELLTDCLVSSRMASKPQDPPRDSWIASDGSPLRGYYWTRIDPKVQPNYWV